MHDGPVTTQRYISEACEEDLLKYGDSFRGAGYTKSVTEAEQRYALMLGVIRELDERVTLLDFGCGLAHLLDHLDREPKYRHVQYTGLDLSPKYMQAAKARRPDGSFILLDVLESDESLPSFDYVIMNGVFNFRGDVPEVSMLQVPGRRSCRWCSSTAAAEWRSTSCPAWSTGSVPTCSTCRSTRWHNTSARR